MKIQDRSIKYYVILYKNNKTHNEGIKLNIIGVKASIIKLITCVS